MKVLKVIGLIVAALLAGGIAAQAMGYIDSPLFNWFTEIHLFK